MCTKMRLLWTILVLGALLQGSYAEANSSKETGLVQSITTKASVTTTSLAPSTDSTAARPTSGQPLTSTVSSPHTTKLISTTQFPTEKVSSAVALTSSTDKDLTKSVDVTSAQHTTGSTITNTRTDTTTPTAPGVESTTKTAQKTAIPTTAPESASTTTTTAPENPEITTKIDSKDKVTQEHTTTVPVPTTTVAQHENSEGPTKPITSGTSYTTTPVTPTSSAKITSVLTTTPALTTTIIMTTPTPTTTMATTRMTTTWTTTTTTTTTTTIALKPKMFNRTIAASSTGDNLERVCAQLMDIINATVNCTMVGKEINGDLKFSSITLNVVEPLVEVNKSTDFESKKQTENIHMTSIAIMASCGALALFLIAFAVYCSCHRSSYRKNQQHLTEELQTVENGYHDNPTLEVMEVQPEMHEKKLALNGEFNDSWLVPFDNLPEEEDTHL